MSAFTAGSLADVVGVLLVNAALASVLVLLIPLARWRGARPGLVHALGLLVLLKLVTPPILTVDLPVVVRAAEPGASGGPAAPSRTAIEGRWRPDAVLLEPDAAASASAPDLPAPRPEASTAPSWSWLDLLVGLWVLGALASYGSAALRMLRFRRLLAYAAPPPAEVVAMQARLCRRMGLARAPELRLLPATVAPMVWSFGRRTWLVIPTRLWERIGGDERAALLAHELAHVLRRDHWVRVLELFVGGLYWWLPPLWWSRRAMRQAEEECCDAWVCWALEGGERAYADALVRTIDFLSGSPSPLPPAASGLGDPGGLKRRLTMILAPSSHRPVPSGSRLAVLLLGAALLPLHVSLAQEAPTPPEPPSAPVAETVVEVVEPVPAPFAEALVESATPQEAPEGEEQLRRRILEAKDQVATLAARLASVDAAGKKKEVARMKEELAVQQATLQRLVDRLAQRRRAHRRWLRADAPEPEARARGEAARRALEWRVVEEREARDSDELRRALHEAHRAAERAQRAADRARAQAERSMREAMQEIERATELRRRAADLRPEPDAPAPRPRDVEERETRIHELERACEELAERLDRMRTELRTLRAAQRRTRDR